jgi:glycine/D-amino acid oxidase-like deaminating enzyme
MDLKSGQPYWPIKNEPVVHYPPLRLSYDVDCEVAIIGAGITGALVAYYLTKEGIATVIVDQRQVGAGSTSATTGLLQYEVDTPLFELIGKVGEKRAVRSYHLCLEAIYGIERLVHKLGDPCDFERKHVFIWKATPWLSTQVNTDLTNAVEFSTLIVVLNDRLVSE